jgi:hypothetical protein
MDRRARAAEARMRVRVMWLLVAVLVPVVAAVVPDRANPVGEAVRLPGRG